MSTGRIKKNLVGTRPTTLVLVSASRARFHQATRVKGGQQLEKLIPAPDKPPKPLERTLRWLLRLRRADVAGKTRKTIAFSSLSLSISRCSPSCSVRAYRRRRSWRGGARAASGRGITSLPARELCPPLARFLIATPHRHDPCHFFFLYEPVVAPLKYGSCSPFDARVPTPEWSKFVAICRSGLVFSFLPMGVRSPCTPEIKKKNRARELGNGRSACVGLRHSGDQIMK